MKKYKKFILLNIILFLSSCGAVKEGFTNQKKNSSDEFLVEKKSPLVMPPNYNELPFPKTDENKTLEKNTNIKKLITDNEIFSTDAPKDINKNFEETLLKKIKNN